MIRVLGAAESPKNVAAIILAAGASKRLGTPKQLVLFGGERLLDRAVRVAHEAGCAPVIVVLGSSAAAIRADCTLRDTLILTNDGWLEGMASSIRVGASAVSGSIDGVTLMTCDQPGVTSLHLRRLIESGAEEPTASLYKEKRGVPAYFPIRYLQALLELQGDEGAGKLLRFAEAIDLPWGEIDIDTEPALLSARSLFD